jgi:hypothetical protein
MSIGSGVILPVAFQKVYDVPHAEAKLLDYVAVLPAAVTDHEAAGVVGLRVRGKHTQPVYGRLYAVDLPE